MLVNEFLFFSYDVDVLRRSIGVVEQEPVLMGNTVGEAVRYGGDFELPSEKSDSSDVDHNLADALQTSYSSGFVSQLPNGVNTEVGDKGGKLSGGQKQRLAIARAILRKPPIVIFDEYQSALDSESSSLVQAAVDKLIVGRTTISVTHRLRYARTASVILVIENGELAQVGTHEKLASEEGSAYARFVLAAEIMEQKEKSTKADLEHHTAAGPADVLAI